MIEPEILFRGRIFHVVREILRTADGQEHVREIVRHPGAVAILPVLDDGRICLIENYRLAVAQALIELPAGIREPGEDPAHTAARELAEETGYRARSVRQLVAFHTSPGILDEQLHLFLATGLKPGRTSLEAGEQITTRLATLHEALEMIQSGRIRDAKTMVGLLYYHAFCRQEPEAD